MRRASRASSVDPITSKENEALLDGVERAAFDYFRQTTNPANGLVADTTRDDWPCSIAVVGFALSAYPAAVERGWVARAEALESSLAALRFFRDSDQRGTPDSTGCNGFYFHFLDMRSGKRSWRSELSMIDTAILIAGALTVRMYFDAETAREAELREIADQLYRRVDWRWSQNSGRTIMQGWKPESGFLRFPVCGAALHPSVLSRMDRFPRYSRFVHASQTQRLFREQPARRPRPA